MLPTFDAFDYIIASCYLILSVTFISALIISIKRRGRRPDDPIAEPLCFGSFILLTLLTCLVTSDSKTIKLTTPKNLTDSKITVTTTSTTPYKTIYRNDQAINVTVKKDKAYSVTLPAIMHNVVINSNLIDKDASKVNTFTFSKNNVTKTNKRLTETIVSPNSPFKKPTKTTTTRIERIEFAKRTYQFNLFDYTMTKSEPIARVTVSYVLDPQKAEIEQTKAAINKLIDN